MKKNLAIIIATLLAVTAFTAFSTSKDINLAAPAVGNDSKATVAEVALNNSQKKSPEAAPHNEPSAVENVKINEADAKATALAHAGVKEADIRNYRIELDRERDLAVYEIEFDAGDYEYDYIINVETGEIVHNEVDKDRGTSQTNIDNNNVANKAPAEPIVNEDKISKDEAKAAALKHAGLEEKDISRFKAELDRERNGLVYEIEFDSGKYEYEYEVSAEDGKVLKNEKEFRD